MENIRFSFSLCINNLFPSLIPFMLLSNILINYNFIDDLSDIFNIIMIKVFKVNKNASFAFIMSILSGTPSNAKYLKDLFDKGLIDINDIQKCLNFCHFTNPIFILGTIGYTFLHDKKLGLIILISHYLSSIIIGCFGKKNIKDYNFIHKNKGNNNFINILKSSINSTIDTLFLILGIITTCIIITCIIDNVISLNDNYKFIYGLIEITQGLKYLSLSNLSIELKSILSSFIISFGGFCIHAQVFSILDNKKIRYIPYLTSRIIHGLLSAILTFLFILIYQRI
jgi:sporulation integral membrane protein YlbJ